MRYMLWLIKLALFVLVLTFAVKNTEVVTVHYYLDQEWRAPLVLVLVVFFSLGVGVGVAVSLARLIRQRREILALKEELSAAGHAGGKAAPVRPSGAP
jgi:lipopolysaccharide assembly protein A